MRDAIEQMVAVFAMVLGGYVALFALFAGVSLALRLTGSCLFGVCP